MPKGERRVRDPTTGGEIIVKDAHPKGESTPGEFSVHRLGGFMDIPQLACPEANVPLPHRGASADTMGRL
jgi:hypothetical protein